MDFFCLFQNQYIYIYALDDSLTSVILNEKEQSFQPLSNSHTHEELTVFMKFAEGRLTQWLVSLVDRFTSGFETNQRHAGQILGACV